MGWTITDEFVVNGMHQDAGGERYAKRHQRVVHETMRYSENKVAHTKFLEGGAVISNTENYFEVLVDHREDPSLKITRTVGSIRGTGGTGSSKERGRNRARSDEEQERGRSRARSAEKRERDKSRERSDEDLGPSTGEQREECEKGSKKEITKDFNDDIEQRGKGDSRREVRKDLGVDMVADETEEKVVGEGTTTDPFVSSQTIVQDLPGYLYELMKEGYSYGVHLRRHIARVRKYRFTTRVRCMRHKQYPKGTGCKAGIVAKLCTDMRGWVVTGENSHNHKRDSMSKKSIDMRVSAIRNSIKKCCPKILQIPYFHYTPKNAQGAKQLEGQKSGLQELPQSQTAKRREVTIISDSDEDFMRVTPRPPDILLTPHRTAPRIIDLDSSGKTDERKDVQDAMEVDEEILDEGRASEDTGDCFLGDVFQIIS
ncbi:hypothetical protein FGB62_16g012 [Gracilaria domingensis]|nr:hypothetical protein FGB62_16g012 [Gracilaria domingensis]